VRVSYDARGTWDYFPEYASFRDREIALTKEPFDLVMPRNPHVVLRGRVAGFDTKATCVPNEVRSTLLLPGGKEEHRGRHWTAMHGIRLLPGKWRLHLNFWPVEDVVVETGKLELDDEKTYTVEVHYGNKVAVVEVGFDFGPRRIDDRVACAVAGRWTRGSKGWSGTRTAADASSVLLVLMPGPYEVTGAIKVVDEVRFATPVDLVVGGGDREHLVLRTERAGGIFIPRVPRHLDGIQFIDLVERGFPTAGVVRDEPFAIEWLGNRNEDTTWWMPPGRYTLIRRDQSDREVRRVVVKVHAGEVTRLREGKVMLELDED
jgi:hypothetical protein